MGFSGNGFTGFIGVAITIPDEVGCVTGRSTGTASASVTLGAPIGVQAGHTMVACVSGGHYAGTDGGTYTLTPPSGWSTVYADPSGLEILSNLYTKIADAADEAQTSSYTWTFTHTGGFLSGIVASHLSWRPRFGTTLGNASAVHNNSPSIASPGGRWQFSYIVQRTRNGFAQPIPDPVVTSEASLLCENVTGTSGGYRAGNLRAYASKDVSPITGAYLGETGDHPRYGMVVAAVS